MKKFILVLVCGLLLAGSSAAFAANSIQALLFPAAFEINDSVVPLGKDYKAVSIDGHAYVPVRFVAENLGATIGYDAELQKIVIRNGKLDLTDPDYEAITVGNLVLTKAGNSTNVTGQLVLAGVGSSENKIEATLSFYNDLSEQLGTVTVKGNTFGVHAQTFSAKGAGDFRNYTAVSLQIKTVNNKAIITAAPVVYENKKYNFTLDLPRSWEGKYEFVESADKEKGTENYAFINQANKAGYGGYLFSISLIDKKTWSETGPTAMYNSRIWKVGEQGDKAFIFIPAGDVQYDPNDVQLTEDYAAMSKYINSIRTSFKFK